MVLRIYFLLCCGIWPYFGVSAADHDRHHHHDTNPDMELRPHWHRELTTQKTYIYNRGIQLPEPPLPPVETDDGNSFDPYDYVNEYESYETNFPDPYIYDSSSGSLHQHDADTTISTKLEADYNEEENEFSQSGDNDLLTDAAAAPKPWYIIMVIIPVLLLF